MREFGIKCLQYIIAVIVTCCARVLCSSAISDLLSQQLLGFLVTILSVYAPTMAIVLGSLDTIRSKFDIASSFKSTTLALKAGLYEQVILIGLTVIVLLIAKSNQIMNIEWFPFFNDATLTFVLIADLWILFDITKAIFMINDLKDFLNGQDK